MARELSQKLNIKILIMYNWNTNIRFVKGVGPEKAKQLESAKICTVGDLLEHKPLDYIYPGVTKIADLPSEGNVLIKGKIEQLWRAANRTPIVFAKIFDGTGVCLATWWNQVYVLQNLREGITVTLWGKVKNNRLQQPNFSTCNFKQEEVAGGLYGGKTEIIRGALREVFKDLEIPDWYNDDDGLISRQGSFYRLHFPKTKLDYEFALTRLKYDEFFLMQLALGLKRRQIKKQSACRIEL